MLNNQNSLVSFVGSYPFYSSTLMFSNLLTRILILRLEKKMDKLKANPFSTCISLYHLFRILKYSLEKKQFQTVITMSQSCFVLDGSH